MQKKSKKNNEENTTANEVKDTETAENAETATETDGEKAKADTEDGEKEKDNAEAKEANEKSELEKQLKDSEDKYLRLTAEYANFRKRTEKEKSDSYAFSKMNTLKELLPVFDSLEMALQNEQKDYEGLRKGVEMTFNNLLNILAKLEVEPFGEVGDTFDPNIHNAVMHVEDDKYKAGEIVQVLQKGYKIGDKVIRPAMVKTAN